MHSTTIQVRSIDAELVRKAAHEWTGNEVTIEFEEKKPGLLSRPQVGQFDLVDIVITAATSSAVKEIITYIRARISAARNSDQPTSPKDKEDLNK